MGTPSCLTAARAAEVQPSATNAFSRLVQKLLPPPLTPLAYGAADVNLVTGAETFPNTTQSETFTTANPDNPNQVCVAFNDSRGANFSNFSGISCSTDGGDHLHPRHHRRRSKPL